PGRARHVGRMVTAAHAPRAAHERDRVAHAQLRLPPELTLPGEPALLDQPAAAQRMTVAVLVVIGVGGSEVPPETAGILALGEGPGPGGGRTAHRQAEQQCRE